MDKRERLTSMWMFGCPCSSIMKLLGFSSIQHVSSTRSRYGLPPRPKGPKKTGTHWNVWTEEQVEIANYLFADGLVPEEIGEQIGRTEEATRSVLRKTGEIRGAQNRKHTVYRRKVHANIARSRDYWSGSPDRCRAVCTIYQNQRDEGE